MSWLAMAEHIAERRRLSETVRRRVMARHSRQLVEYRQRSWRGVEASAAHRAAWPSAWRRMVADGIMYVQRDWRQLLRSRLARSEMMACVEMRGRWRGQARARLGVSGDNNRIFLR